MKIESGHNQDREDYIQLIRSRFARLPDIQQEIEASLAQTREGSVLYEGHADRVSSRLHDASRRLEDLRHSQDILKEPEINKLQPIFRKLEKAKSIARLATFELKTNLELGLSGWQIDKRPKVTVCPSFLWAAVILPAFDLPARVTVAHKDSGYLIAFALCASPDTILPSVIRTDLPSSWADPLPEALRDLNLFQDMNRINLDGIEYELHSHTTEIDAVIRFSNPSTSPFIEIEKCFLDTVEIVVTEKGNETQKEYLSSWKRYFRPKENA